MNKLDLWMKVKAPPYEALKTIAGGRLKGMTDIKPQWRYFALTEYFGPCGIGWKYTIDKLWREDGANGEVMAFAQVSIFVKDGEKWSDAIQGVGGSTLIDKESSGLHSCDEGYKMALTDALSVAMKTIGVAADVYMGAWDGSKYREDKLSIYGEGDDVAALQDTRDSKGQHSPPTDPGKPATRGDGIASDMLKGRTLFNNLMAEKDDAGSMIFSPADIKDIQADLSPGGRVLISSQADLDYLRDKYAKWTRRRNDILLDRAGLDKAVEGFELGARE